MKQIPGLLQADFNQPTTSKCLILRVLTKSGLLLGFTNLDVNVVYDPATVDPEGTGDDWGSAVHKASNGFMPERLQMTGDLSVDNTEFIGVVQDTGITEAQIRAGIFDFAEVRCYRVNYRDLSRGHELVMTGTLGETDFSALSWSTEFRSLTQQLKQAQSDLYSISCQKEFGSKPIGTGGEQPEEKYPCGMDWVWVSGTVTSVDGAEPDRIFTASGLGQPSAYFEPGVLRVLDGPNAGADMDVDVFVSGGVITLALPLPYAMEPGVNFEIRQDCNKLLRERAGVPGDCKGKHNNAINYGGQFDIPVADGGTLMVPGALIRQ